jgi:hypothetical protein
MTILVLLLALHFQSVLGPVGDCTVVVEVVDPLWQPTPGIEVVIRDERTGAVQTKQTGNDGTIRVVVQTCSDDRCRFSISAGGHGFKQVTLKRLLFWAAQNSERHVQIRLTGFNVHPVTVR